MSGQIANASLVLLGALSLMLIGAVIGNAGATRATYLRAHGLAPTLTVYEENNRHFTLVGGKVFWLEPEETR